MARIPYPDPQQLDARAQAILAKLPALNIFRMLGHNSGVLEGITVLGNALLLEGKLDPILREIAIIRTGLLRNSRYEVHQHERIGQQLGMSAELLAAIHEGPQASAFSEVQRQVMRLTEDIARNSRASDLTLKPLAARLSQAELLELLVCVGFYTMISDLLNTLDIEIESPLQTPEVLLPAL
ncbi:carboxymuconolactone decarboxylase family protein [Pseudomonas sp. N040]|uniref:carboxymuconolactone decarboxylase family protein n=1 Tax=Pseudomonas sp. N040 TaxID=2785325 RepID=UPI0018A2DBBB|nr:carboxymuconolactone decarboxylase family protein [Pseudomonas sp. N040]MBF7731240.1 carboxymuconolactone decarboxylase family protein [Pseudomonas sp. N040]MBW7014883.1 carboxymuconolactone decarboxylase family protein [Pseudomonas sp. N040]